MSDLHRLTMADHDGVLVVTVDGEIDMSNAAELESTVMQRADSAAGVVVDLVGVSFVDSAGVRFLDHLAAALADRVLVVAPTPGRVRSTLRLCGFPDDLVRDESVAAVTALQRRG